MSDEMERALEADREKLIGLGADPGPTEADLFGAYFWLEKAVEGYSGDAVVSVRAGAVRTALDALYVLNGRQEAAARDLTELLENAAFNELPGWARSYVEGALTHLSIAAASAP